MERKLSERLIQWKASDRRKPLIIQGARQVGKTWLMKNFGSQEFSQTAYINFEKSGQLRNLFVQDFNIERIILSIEIETGLKINAGNTLIIFDELQEAPKGITALKYFYEDAPKYFIVAAGSLLGVSLHKETSFPIGKVDFFQMHPMSFQEFLVAIDEQTLAQQVQEQSFNILDVFHDKLIEKLRLYYFVGGMPEAVLQYVHYKDLTVVREIQQKILIGYENDFSKYAPNSIVPKIKMVWNGVLSQLAKENKKFIYGHIKEGARAKEFEEAINWLCDAGLLHKVFRVNKAALPLKSYIHLDAFKLFFLDIGLLNAMAELPPQTLLGKNTILTEYKGAMSEQYVCQQLVLKHFPYYWSAKNGTSEVDFVIQSKNEVVPIEVKAEENLKSKSLGVFQEKFQVEKAIRLSMSKFRDDQRLKNIPLYAAQVL